jgi:hypothetical protein
MLLLRPEYTVYRADFYGFLYLIRVGAARVHYQSKTQRFVHAEDLGTNLLAGYAADAGFLINHWYFLSHIALLLGMWGKTSSASFLFSWQEDGMLNYILTSGKMKIRSFLTWQE